MANPLDVILSLTCDRVRLVADVEKIAKSNLLDSRTCWEYLRDKKDIPGWLKIVANEEIQKSKNNVNSFVTMLKKVGVCN